MLSRGDERASSIGPTGHLLQQALLDLRLPRHYSRCRVDGSLLVEVARSLQTPFTFATPLIAHSYHFLETLLLCSWSDLGHALTRFLPGTDAVQT